jgi:acetyl-CoA acyltransferase
MLSNVPITLSPPLARAVVGASQARSLTGKVKSLRHVKLHDLPLETPAIAETSTGLSMGQSAELMAKENGIKREDQDAWALGSHRKAAAAWDDGRSEHEVAPVYASGRPVDRDGQVRRDTSLDKLAQLPPVFDRAYGSVTAGNSSPLTDGAASVLLMADDVARALGYSPKALVRSYAYHAVDPAGQLLLGPAYAIPLALDRAGVALQDMDLVEMHEAFAAQVLSNLQGFVSREWAQRAGFDKAVGEVDLDRLNVMGGSISIGHPFGATGGRILTTLVNELRRRDGQFGLMTVCAAGGMGHAMVVERRS